MLTRLRRSKLPDTHALHAHQFDSMEQQRESTSLGMWIFLVTEIMFFGGLFLVYIVYRGLFHEGFVAGSHHLDITLGAINTAVLIGSSLTMALAVRASQMGKRNLTILFLLFTIILGGAFLGIKVVEYGHKFHDHLVPGPLFQWEEKPAIMNQVELFYSLYFCMTGLHATHMIIGIGILLTLMYHAKQGRYSPEYHAPVELTGLYWHFVDIVWIFLFPFLYLLGRH